MEQYCDLHVHSCYSDGTCTPQQLIQLARQAELQAVALCDHNTLEGVPEFLAAAENSGVEAVPGIEFSTDYRGTELHILALYIQPEHYDKIRQLMDRQRQRKEQSNLDLVARLNAAGYALDYQAIKAATPSGNVNRALIAAELTRLGYVTDIQSAFKELLSPKKGYYIPPSLPDAYEIIALIKSLGAVAVLAHPFLSMDAEALEGFLPRAVELGLDGMEILYPKYDEPTTRLAAEMARQYGLLPSGGSDFHGQNKPDIQMGIGRGNLQIPMAFLTELKKLRE